ncbi:MAG: SIR2 family NAD-dependent protein deacylase [Pyrinomonadaceae bacterium]
MDQNDLTSARAAVERACRVFVLTGAGISAESGVPTFRGGGRSLVWRGMPFEQISSARMVNDDLPLVWEWFDHRIETLSHCKPNPGHAALAEAQGSGRFDEFTIATQNVDGLHAEAGARDVIELHGNARRARCLDCGFRILTADLPAGERPPVCPVCGSAMRPDVVLFGEMLDAGSIASARDAAAMCEVCLVVGTSALVYPANELPHVAAAAGAAVVEINPEDTPLTPFSTHALRGAAGEILPALLTRAA